MMDTDTATRDQGWIYEHAADGTARFVLGVAGENPLVCVGINPSTAVPGAPDPTVKRVTAFAERNGFDAWTMLNVYPQIATDPKDLHQAYVPALKAENEQRIEQFIGGRRLTLLAAWGALIEIRRYLPVLLSDVVRVVASTDCTWVALGEPTKNGHPRHPLYVRGDAELRSFDIGEYARVVR